MNANLMSLNVLHDRMQHCIVLKKVGHCTCYELYDEETNTFLVACVSCVLLSPMLLFVSSQDCHLRKFEDICCNLNIRLFVAKMLPDWMTGLNYKLTAFDESLICDIRIRHPVLTSAPVSFSMRVHNPDFDPDDHSCVSDMSRLPPSRPSRNPHANFSFFPLFSCLGDVSCFESHDLPAQDRAHEKGRRHSSSSYECSSPSNLGTTQYTTISATSQTTPMLELRTRAPPLSNDHKIFADHYGGRVRVPCRQNFTVHREAGEFLQSAEQLMPDPDDPAAKPCILHGKTGVNTFVLDYRAPATALTAFAAMCAVHS